MEMATVFRALADDTRLRIMLLLQVMELSVGELALVLEQSQPRVSRHVRILVEAGLAERRKEGSWVFLRDALNQTNSEAERLLAGFLRRGDVIGAQLSADRARDVERLEQIRAQRDENAARYFADHADQWDTIRTLYIPETEIEDALMALLEGEALGRLLDIGTGTGRMVELFADRAGHCTALDKSPEMLRLARSKLQHLPPDSLDLVQADFNDLPLADDRFDTIILHQVLHFAQNPRQVIGEAGRVARIGGRIAVVDFAAHDHDDLRDSDAHVRLGFNEEQIQGYFAASGFTFETSQSLPGRDLTVEIWLGRKTGSHPGAIERPEQAANDTAKMPNLTQRKTAA